VCSLGQVVYRSRIGLWAAMIGWKEFVSSGIYHVTSYRPALKATSVSALRVYAR